MSRRLSHPLPIGTTVYVRRDFAVVESIILGYFHPSTEGYELSQDPDHYDSTLRYPYWIVPRSSLTLTEESSLEQITGEL